MNPRTVSYWSNGLLIDVIDGVIRRARPKGDGISRAWHTNGELEEEWTRVGGKIAGAFRKWHDNGQLAFEKPYNDGKIDGIVKQWNRDGKLLGEYEMKMGKGIIREWNDDGSPNLELENIAEGFDRGKVWDDLGKGREIFLRNGKPISKKKFFERLKKAGIEFLGSTAT
jgi:MORN repeat variant